MENISYRDRQLTAQILKYNTQMAKAMADIYKEIDNNTRPDFAKITDLSRQMKTWLQQIEKLAEALKARKFDPKKLVSAYLYDTESFGGWLTERMEHIQKVKEKVNTTRVAWVYSDKTSLQYSPEQWLDNSAIQLAKFMNIDLS